MANEVALCRPYNVSADVFSFAMVSYEMLSLQKPYDGWTREMHTQLVCHGGVRPDTSNCVCPIPLEMTLLLQLAWHQNSSQRPTTDQIVSQLSVFTEQQHLLLQKQRLELQVAQQQLETQRRTQQELAAAVEAANNRTFYIDMNYQMAPLAPRKMSRQLSDNSIGTIETTSLSSDSMDF